MSPDHLLNLPWEIQVALASGYAAYAVAYLGLRDRHRPIDVVFISLVFSLITTAVLWFLASYKNPVVSIPSALVATIIAGTVWRRFLHPFVFSILRYFDVTWSNDDPSALATILDDRRSYITQIAVLLEDGTWLRCDDVQQFRGAPFWPCIIGPNGDVALYLTHEEPKDSEAKTLATVRDSLYGDRLTYIPASRIKQITMRRKPKVNRSSTAVAAEESKSAERPEPSAA
jgi:hypothetical protein